MHGLRQEKNRLDVQVHDFVPTRFREGLEGLTPGGAGVINQYVDRRFVLGHGRCQRLAAIHRSDVLGHGDTVRSQLIGHRLADISLAAGNIDFGTLSNKATGNHFTDTAGAAGY